MTAQNKLWIPSLAVLSLLAAGCGSIVLRPQVHQVKSAAVVSLYANARVPAKGGGGIVRDWPEQMRTQVAEDALLAWGEELERLGWRLVPGDRVIQSAAYQDTFRADGANQSGWRAALVSYSKWLARGQYFAPAGMMPVVFTDGDARTGRFAAGRQADERRKALASLAERLDVDAVVIVQVDYCYQAGMFSLLGTGQAVMTAASSVKAVNRRGEVVVNMPQLQRCEQRDRAKSSTSAAMLQGDLLFQHLGQDRFRSMFMEATRGSAEKTRMRLERELAK